MIRKQVLEVQFDYRMDKFRTQQLVSDYYKDTILPALEHSFDQLSDREETLYMDQLAIDLGRLDLTRMESRSDRAELEVMIHEQFRNILETSHPGHGERKPYTRNVFEQWLYYLEKGYLPWNSSGPLTLILDQVRKQMQDSDLLQQLRDLLKKHPSAMDRLIYQHRDEFLLEVITDLMPGEKKKIHQMIQGYRWFMQQLSKIDRGKYVRDRESTRHQIWRQLIMKGIRQEPPVLEELIRLMVNKGTRSLNGSVLERINGDAEKDHSAIINQLLPILEEGSHVAREAGEKEDAAEPVTVADGPDEEGIFVPHAGMVLLHPFLKSYFQDLGLIREGRFQTEKARQKALYLLHFLATGEEGPGEDMLVVPKLLCDFPLEAVVSQPFRLNRKERSRSVDLLKAIIARWTVLKKTSPATLQQQFLQRNGKLYSRGGKIYLQVETSSIDVLLDRLPWNLGTVKLPWKKEIIWVEWR